MLSRQQYCGLYLQKSMSLTKMPIQKWVLLLALVGYSTIQASSLKCYDCIAFDESDECFTNPKQSTFETTCVSYREIRKIVAADSRAGFILNNLLANYTSATDSKSVDCEGCGTIIMTAKDEPVQPVMIRSCLPSDMSCKALEEGLAQMGIVLKLCSSCNSDLCNAKKL